MLLLRLLFIVVIVSMLGVTTWASLHTPIFKIPREVFLHPWFLATLVDAYWAFITFFVWVAWKEQSLAARLLWFVAIVALGNIAMAAYMLRELFRLSGNDAIGRVFTERRPGHVVLPSVLAGIGVIVYLAA